MKFMSAVVILAFAAAAQASAIGWGNHWGSAHAVPAAVSHSSIVQTHHAAPWGVHTYGNAWAHHDGSWAGAHHDGAWAGAHHDGSWAGAHHDGSWAGAHDDGSWHDDHHDGAWAHHDGSWAGAHHDGAWGVHGHVLAAPVHIVHTPVHAHAVHGVHGVHAVHAVHAAPIHAHVHAEASYVAANRGSVHSAPLPGHAISQKSLNLEPAAGTW